MLYDGWVSPPAICFTAGTTRRNFSCHCSFTCLLLRSICSTGKFVTADVTAVYVNDQHGIQWQGQDFDNNV